MTHALLTAVWCLILWCTDIHATAFAIPAVWYMGREYAQAEYRIIESKYNRKRALMPWYAPMTPEAWTVKGVTDFVFPAIVALILGGLKALFIPNLFTYTVNLIQG